MRMERTEERIAETQRITIRERLKNFISSRQDAYRAVFQKGPMSEKVLRDLAKFCRANKTTFHEDPRAHAVLEGRREVWLRIQEHLNLTAEQVIELHGKDV